jgi:hypothetical protein
MVILFAGCGDDEPAAPARPTEVLARAAPGQAVKAARPALDDLTATLVRVRERSIYRDQLEPARAFAAAVDAVAAEIPAVRVQPGSGEIKIAIGTVSRRFETANLDSLWRLDAALRKVAALLVEQLQPAQYVAVEPAMIQGILATVDPDAEFRPPLGLDDRPRPPGFGPPGLHGRVGYAPLFDGGNFGQLRAELGKLRKAGAAAFVVDFRGARDGTREDAGHLVELFAGPDSFQGIPVVVLVDARTDGAAELAAGALQRLRRATVAGAATTGSRGTREAFDLEDGSRLILTVATWSPGGKPLDAVVPDLPIEPADQVVSRAIDRAARMR